MERSITRDLLTASLRSLPAGSRRVVFRSSSVNGVRAEVPAFISKIGEGPTVVICAGMHGDEWTGIQAVLELRQLVRDRVRAGTLLLVPVLNSSAFEAKSRRTPIDGKNMNREFRADISPATYTEVVAHGLDSAIFSQADIVLDLHSGGENELMRHVRVMSEKDRELWPYLGTDVVQVLGDLPAGFLCKRCEERGQSMFTIEIGAGFEVDFRAATVVAKGLSGFLQHIGIAEPGFDPPMVDKLTLFNDYACVHSPVSGLWRRQVSLGEPVKSGSVIGVVIETATGRTITVRSTADGTVFSLRKWAASSQGESLAEIAFFTERPSNRYFRPGKVDG